MTKENTPTEYNLRKDPKKPKGDVAILGWVLGIIFPCLGIFVLYWLQWTDMSLSQYLKMFTNVHNPYNMNQASKVISLAVIMNLIPFYFFLNRKAMQAVKGVVIASVLALLLVVFYKFIWQ